MSKESEFKKWSESVNAYLEDDGPRGAWDACWEIQDAKLKEACDLLHECLEWDNGVLPQERGYNKIIAFLNKHDEEINGKKI